MSAVFLELTLVHSIVCRKYNLYNLNKEKKVYKSAFLLPYIGIHGHTHVSSRDINCIDV